MYTHFYACSLCNASFLTLLSFTRSRDASEQILSVFDGVIGIYFVLSLRSLCAISVQPSSNLSAGGRSYRNFDICHRQGTSSRNVIKGCVGSKRIVFDVTMTRPPPHLRLSLLRPGDISTDLLMEGFPAIDRNRGYRGHFCQST